MTEKISIEDSLVELSEISLQINQLLNKLVSVRNRQPESFSTTDRRQLQNAVATVVELFKLILSLQVKIEAKIEKEKQNPGLRQAPINPRTRKRVESTLSRAKEILDKNDES